MIVFDTRKLATLRVSEDSQSSLASPSSYHLELEKPAPDLLPDLDPEAEPDAVQEHDGIPENLTARYLGEVRRFSLLKPAEERAAWARIEHYKARLRRALATSPVALRTLRQCVEHAAHGGPAVQSTHETDAATGQRTELRPSVDAAILSLEQLSAALETLAASAQRPRPSTPRRRALRQERLRLWRQWLTEWEALRLSPAVEAALGSALLTARQAQPDCPALRAAQAAYTRAQRQLTAAQEDMLTANLRLVIHIAKRYHHHDVPLLDLIQEGNIGLMRAIEKFEPRRGVRFVTYAHWWVRQAISRSVQEQNRTVRIPSHVAERQTKLRIAADRFWNEQHRPPAVQELSTVLGWSPQEVAHLQTVGQPIVRLQTPLSADTRNAKTLIDILEDPHRQLPEDFCAEEQMHHRLGACLDSLGQREAFVLRLRYGLEADHAHSLQEIATILGLSRERVRQVEHQALKKLAQSRHRQLLAELAEV